MSKLIEDKLLTKLNGWCLKYYYHWLHYPLYHVTNTIVYILVKLHFIPPRIR